VYAVFFQTYWLRLAIFFSCLMMFSQLFRGEMMEKTLHFYLLSPVRREVIAAGKYLAGVIAAALIFGACTVATNVLIYVNRPGWTTFFSEGDGLNQLTRYVLAVVLACVAYGAIFMLLGLLFRLPMIPAAVLLAWEFFYFVMPAGLQRFTVMHYLQSFLPLSVDLGAFAVVADPTSPLLGVPLLLVFAAVIVWISGRILRTTQISYSTD
jgi:ABC-type transport system involved in multi-copper enzyme maturation permease subunit